MTCGNPFLAVVPKFTTIDLTFAFVPRRPAALSLCQLLVLGASCPDGTWYVRRSPPGTYSHANDTDFLCLVTKFTPSLVLRSKWPRPSLLTLTVSLRSDVPMSLIGTDFSRGEWPCPRCLLALETGKHPPYHTHAHLKVFLDGKTKPGPLILL